MKKGLQLELQPCNLSTGGRPYAPKERSDHQRTFYVYRFWAREDALLYVGMSTTPNVRLADHRVKDWWSEVVRSEQVGYATEDEAREAERQAILSENPIHNRIMSTRGEADRPPLETRDFHDETLNDIRAIAIEIQALTAHREALVANRNTLIVEAWSSGFSMRDVGSAAGVSHQAVKNVIDATQ